MKPTVLYSDHDLLVTMEKRGKYYIGTYGWPISALEEMAGVRPRQIVAKDEDRCRER